MALWLLKQGIDARVVAIGLLKDEDRVYLQPQVLIPPPAEPVVVGAAPSKMPWLIDGESWHLDHRCGAEGREILERVVALIAREVPAADPPSWSQKFYISWSWGGRGWAFLSSGPKSAYLELKKIDISAEEAATRLGYSVFDEEADLKAKLALGSSVARHNEGLRLILKSKDDVAGEKASSLAALIREAWTQMTGKSPVLVADHGSGDEQNGAILPADTARS
jgi:hypothetical protein